jgi:hypothetical protein
MNTLSILNDLRQQRDRINKAITALEQGTGSNRRGRQLDRQPAGNGRRGRRKLSAAARKRISVAAKARWAKAKRARKNRL